MTFVERYYAETTWQGKVMVMEIYHLARTANNPNWTISMTATEFDVSIGLVSENLKLAYALHNNPKVLSAPNRQEALKKLNGNGRY
jgi:hypothetical protein